jgi:hypothetical protein
MVPPAAISVASTWRENGQPRRKASSPECPAQRAPLAHPSRVQNSCFWVIIKTTVFTILCHCRAFPIEAIATAFQTMRQRSAGPPAGDKRPIARRQTVSRVPPLRADPDRAFAIGLADRHQPCCVFWRLSHHAGRSGRFCPGLDDSSLFSPCDVRARRALCRAGLMSAHARLPHCWRLLDLAPQKPKIFAALNATMHQNSAATLDRTRPIIMALLCKAPRSCQGPLQPKWLPLAHTAC